MYLSIVNRRHFVALVGVSAVSGCLGGIASDIDDAGRDDLMTQSLHGDFTKVEFESSGKTTIHFSSDNDAEGFIVRHASEDDFKHIIYGCEAPRFDGTRAFNLVKIVNRKANNGVNYPNHKFEVVGAKGGFSSCDLGQSAMVTEKTSSARFKIPKELIDDVDSADDSTNTQSTTTDDGIDL